MNLIDHLRQSDEWGYTVAKNAIEPNLAVAGLEPHLQPRAGFGIYRWLKGQVDKRNPAECLGDAADHRNIWEHA